MALKALYQIDVSGAYKLSFSGQATLVAIEGTTRFENQRYDPPTNTTTADLVVPTLVELAEIARRHDDTRTLTWVVPAAASEALAAGERLGVRVVPGVEINLEHDGATMDMLGYFLRGEPGKALGSQLIHLRASRDERNARILARLAELGMPLEPFVLAVLFGANLSFVTPMAYQTNLLIMNAACYKFGDFVRIGVPLSIGLWLILTVVLVWAYGL